MNSTSFSSQFPAVAVEFDPFADGEVLVTALATESQKEIWASVQMGADANCAYNESVSLWVQGELNVEALRSAFQELVQRHESLRTTFSPDGHNLCVAESPQIEIPLVDWSLASDLERSEKLANAKHQAVSTPFDLEHGPLFRVELFRLQPEEHVLILTVHHIVFDGWSWGVIIPELGKLYSAFRQGKALELEDPDRFSDYALMLEEVEGSEEAITTETYWLQQFTGTVPVVDFPTDRPRPPLRTFDSAREDLEISVELVSALKQLGSASGCSFMTVLLAGFEAFMHRLTEQDDLVVGISAAGQAASGQYNLVGHCVNLLPLRTQVSSKQAFSDYLKSRKSTVLDAYDHQQFTFGRLLQKLALPRDPSRIPLVPIIFNIDQGLDSRKLSFERLEVKLSSNPRTFENFELFINATELAGKLTLECQYNTNLFDAATIRRRLAEFETLLTGIVDNPDRSIATLPLLPPSEQQQLAAWNQTQAAYPQDLCIHQLVEAQVALAPDAIAVVFEDQSLTYRELDQRANQLARYLQAQGVGAEVLVGICVERSLEMVIGVLGILKAGGAYLPLDPAYPPDRTAFMLEDAQVSVLLTQNALKANLPSFAGYVVCLDIDWETIATALEAPKIPPTSLTPDNLAYIIYTSGSTGKPKGVQIQHRSAVNLLHSVQQQPGLTAQDTLLSVTTLSFDISVSELFLPLIVGAKLVVVSQDVARDGLKLMQAITDCNATFMQPTPATWRLLLSAGWQGNPQMKLVSTGEALPRDLADQLLPKGSELWNLYGPTEITIWATGCQVGTGSSAINIGTPIANTQTYILDSHLQPVPIGVPGELHIGGAGLARGYLNRPELTAEKFIPDPFSAEPGARLYKTGDLARFLPNGQIECIGRIDYQVKVRGFRIELGEIESVLLQHPAVKEAIAIVREYTPGEKILVGYFVSQAGTEGTSVIPELRRFLKAELPEYMVPTIFMAVEAMPLTPNGKVDRKALPQPDAYRPELAANYVAPRTSLETQIAEIWAQVLKLERVGVDDNFFELGGYSLLATQVITRLRQTISIELPLRTFFEASTVAGLADRIETLQWATQSGQTVTSGNGAYEEGEL
jgi:amino acid adenylation domain-containing protein